MQGNSLHKIKMTIFVVVALALMGLSFHGALDEFAHESVTKTTNQSILILAVTGAIDAAISLLQSLEVEGGFMVASGSLQLGELLDPINDAVERLLSVMIWAVGSLALQLIIIDIASSFAFKWAFLGIGLTAIAAWRLGTWQRIRDLFEAWDGFSAFLVRIFIFMAVFRFIVPVFAIISFLVGHLLFDAEIDRSKEVLSLASAGISVDANTPVPGTPEFEEQRTLKVSELDELRERMTAHMEEAEALDARIQELRGGGLRQYLPGSLGGTSADEQQALKESGTPELDELYERKASYLEEDEALDARIRGLRDGANLRQYLPEGLGGASPDEWQALQGSGVPELDELYERKASHLEEDEALAARIQELRGGVLRQYLPESLGGASPDERRSVEGSGVPELDELYERKASYLEEDKALEAQIQELRGGGGLRQYLPESLGGTSPDERQALEGSGVPELDELRERMASYMEEDEALEARIEELSDEAGLRQYLPESLGGVSPGEELEAAKARRKQIGLEMEAIESRARAMEGELLATAQARREQIGLEMEAVDDRIRVFEEELLSSAEARRKQISLDMEAIESRIRAREGEWLASAETRREEIRREMEAVDDRIHVFEGELLASAEARREEVSGDIETAESQIRVVEEELECIEKRSAGEDCVSLLGNLSAMAQEGYARIRDLVGRAGEIVATTVKLMIFVIVKNILLPVAFLMIAVKCALPIAKYGARLTSDFRRDVKELADTVSPRAGSAQLKERSEGA